MKLLHRNAKQGTAKVLTETADDLWYLYTLLDPGDICTGRSEYKMKLSAAGEKTKVARKNVWAGIRVEKTEFDQSTGSLRLTGKVVGGSEELPRGEYHSLSVEPGYDLEIWKEHWLSYHEEKLDEAVHASNMQTLLVLFDREQALFAMLKPDGHDVLLEMKGDVPKKGLDEQKTRSFYHDIIEKLKDYQKRHKLERIVAASPAFWKEYLKKEMPPDLEKTTIFATVSAVDESAIKELLQRPEVQQAIASERTAKEASLLEEMMAALAEDKLAYGQEDIRQAITNGNIKILAVTENEIRAARAEDRFDILERLMRSAEDISAKVHLLSTQDAMRKLDSLGGVAGLKRW